MTTKDLKKENIIILDVETARPTKKDLTKKSITYYKDAIGKNLVYDIGLMVVALPSGRTITKRNFVVKEIFFNEMFMESAYYKEKLNDYYVDIAKKVRQVRTMRSIQSDVQKLVDKYNVSKIFAYNCNFDKNALNTTSEYLSKRSSKEEFFSEDDFDFCCIWNMACQTLMNNEDYREFCNTHNLMSNNGNISTSAENCYRFLNNDECFVEKHTGLEDVKIEKQILLECLQTETECCIDIDTQCWKKAQLQDRD